MRKTSVSLILALGTAHLVLTHFAISCTTVKTLSKNTSINATRSETAHSLSDHVDQKSQAQIIEEVLKQEYLATTNKRDENSKKLFNVLANINALKQIRVSNNFEIMPISGEEMRMSLKTSFEYLEFKDFRRRQKATFVTVIKNKRDSTSIHSSATEYECKNIGDVWQVKGRITSVAVGEKP